MKRFRLLILLLVAGAVFSSQISTAFADSTPLSTTCTNKTNAFKSATYKVDGTVVPDLRGHAHSGAKVTVDFLVASGCKNVPFGLAAYTAPSGKYVPAEAPQQRLVASQKGTYSDDGKTHELQVTLPDCFYQVDFFVGVPLDRIGTDGGYINGTLIAADNGGTKACPPPPPPPPSCPTTDAAKLVSYDYTITHKDGTKQTGVKSLQGNLKSGDTVTVNFKIAASCKDVELSLVSYKATSATFTKETGAQQTLFKKDTGKWDAGDHTMTVTVPDCYFQVDFVRGAVIEKLGPANTNNYYSDQGRLIDSGNGGQECTTTPPPPSAAITGPSCSTTDAVVKLNNTGTATVEFSIYLDGVLSTTNGKVSVDGNKSQEVKIPVTKSTKISVRALGMANQEMTVAPASDCIQPSASVERKCVIGGDSSWVVTFNNTSTEAKDFSVKANGVTKTVNVDKASSPKTATYKRSDFNNAPAGTTLEVFLGNNKLASATLTDCDQPVVNIAQKCVVGSDSSWQVVFKNSSTTDKATFVVKVNGVALDDQKVTINGGGTDVTKTYTISSLNAKLGQKLEIFVGDNTTPVASTILNDCAKPVVITQKCVAGAETSWDVVLTNTSATDKVTFTIKVNGVSKTVDVDKASTKNLTYKRSDFNAASTDTLEVWANNTKLGSTVLADCDQPVVITQKCVVGSETSWDIVLKNISTTDKATFTIKVNGVSKTVDVDKASTKNLNYKRSDFNAASTDTLEVWANNTKLGSTVLADCVNPVVVTQNCAADGSSSWDVALKNTSTTDSVTFNITANNVTKTVTLDKGASKTLTYTLADFNNATVGQKLEVFVGDSKTALVSVELKDCSKPVVSIDQTCAADGTASWNLSFKNLSTTTAVTFNVKANGITKTVVVNKAASTSSPSVQNATTSSLTSTHQLVRSSKCSLVTAQQHLPQQL